MIAIQFAGEIYGSYALTIGGGTFLYLRSKLASYGYSL